MYILKKLIPVFALVLLCACSAKTYTPVINTEFDLTAVYKTGDFSYPCEIIKSKDAVSITALDTAARGMTIKCDGRNVTFKFDSMEKLFEKDSLDKTNPAVILWEVFFSLDEAQVKKVEDGYEYRGRTGAGSFVLVQNRANSLVSLDIESADIHILFDSEQ